MIEDHDVDRIVNYLFEHYGYDFTNYARASLKRRISRVFTLDKLSSLDQLNQRLQTDSDYLKQFVEELTVNVTEMFRDPSFYKTLRIDVLSTLTAKPFIRIWHAGCSTGEEVYSMAILLKETGLLQKSLLYATDLHVKFDEALAEKMIFSTHNLVSDRSFNEFDIIVCRNVLIYFDKDLQDRVLTLFNESLGLLGYLALGSKETLKFSDIQSQFKQLSKEKIWRKVSV